MNRNKNKNKTEIYIDIFPICGGGVKLHKNEIICVKCVASFKYPRFSFFGKKLYIKKRKESYYGVRDFLLLACFYGIFISWLFLSSPFQNLVYSLSLLSGSISIFMTTHFGNKEGVIYLKNVYITKREEGFFFEYVIFLNFIIAVSLFLFSGQLFYEEMFKVVVIIETEAPNTINLLKK